MLACPTIEKLREELDPVLNGLFDRLEGEEFPPLSSGERELARKQCLSLLKKRYFRALQMSLVQTEARDAVPPREAQPQVQQANRGIKEIDSMQARRAS